MKIQLNGGVRHFEKAMTLADLLEVLELGGKPVVVELDEQAVFPRDYPSLWVNDGARLEVVSLAAGG